MRYIVQHRRGTTTQWQNSTDTLHEGEIGIEYSDDYKMARILIGSKNGVIDALQFTPISKIVTISLPEDAWVGDNSPYSQTFEVGTISGVTSKSKIDLQPTVELLEYLQNEEIVLTSENNDGVVTFYALGWKPEMDIEIQATINEMGGAT